MDRLDMMTAFAAVARHGGFAPAARQLGISTSALSRHIAALEDWLGVQLFHRSTRSVRLSDSGQGYLRRCQNVLDEVREIEQAGQDAQTALSGKLRLSAPVYLGRNRVAPLVARFLHDHPAMRIDLFLTDRLVDMVTEGVDLAIRVTKPADSSLIARRIGATQISVVAAPAYLARRGTPKAITDLTSHDCIVDRSPDGSNRWHFQTPDGRVSRPVDGHIRVNDGETARDFAIDGLGLAHLPLFFVQDALDRGDLIRVKLDDQPEHIGIYAIYPPSRHLSRGLRALLDHIAYELAL
ncbi:LysR family transcriptional regulator [Alisedimentitalea sp. MJ-SS2]|uniref:LysR family transcriptional regulator n=1 Tax=Aliisedimentitalea sp. MJ-SS2 TaxID=3049795 RepID=UPI0029096958|nr:LysR family transcriptional regulator [Alisedimentitalea sp. MJ-SS2]MDU8929328.1 LysR family transcriptional regulator [Alisedimentitalea sp. MJ-SS2]